MVPPRRLDHDVIASQYLNRLDLTIADIALMHGCDRNTVLKIARRRGLTSTVRLPLRHDHGAIAADYVAGGLTITEIARTHGCDPTTVHDIARSLGLSRSAAGASG